ncbi:MAG: CDP-alcohol phosphatidyltransferase family protein [Micromonosporaceae bacterium]
MSTINGTYRRVGTVPNLISLARLVGVPVFLYLLLVAERQVAALVVLAAGAATDWLDGWAARRLGQVSRVGELLDPLVDRVYIVATLLAFTVQQIVPWQFTAALVVRELVLLVGLAVLRRAGHPPPQVHYLGKTATFVLLAAFPLLLLAAAAPGTDWWSAPVGWALAWWGVVLYWVAGVLYLVQMGQVVRQARRREVTRR